MMDSATVWRFFHQSHFFKREKLSLGNSYCHRLSQLVAPSIALNSLEIVAWNTTNCLFWIFLVFGGFAKLSRFAYFLNYIYYNNYYDYH